MLADAVWGEGFASDVSLHMATVRDWAELTEGEGVRFFPSLRRHGDNPPPQLVVQVLARAAQIESVGRAGDAGWVLETSEDATWLRSIVTSSEIRRGIRDLRLMARFAFLTGLHPAYLWPEVEILPNWGTTAAWLGELSRRGRARMPPEVADFLGDALAREQGRTVCRDASLAEILRDEALASNLLRSARRCLADGFVEVHCRNDVSTVSAACRRLLIGVALLFSIRPFRRGT